jgi:hypothetical protein
MLGILGEKPQVVKYGVQNYIMGVKARNEEYYDFEVSKDNYRK